MPADPAFPRLLEENKLFFTFQAQGAQAACFASELARCLVLLSCRGEASIPIDKGRDACWQ